MKKTKKCRQCGKEFKPREKKSKFCNRWCYRLYCRRDFDRVKYPVIWKDGRRQYYHRVVYAEENMHTDNLTSDDLIHHIDGNPFNRSPDNLEKVKDKAEHLRLHGYHKKKYNDTPCETDFNEYGW